MHFNPIPSIIPQPSMVPILSSRVEVPSADQKSIEKRYAESLAAALKKFATTTKPPLLIYGIKVGSIGFWFGPPKSGKTTILENLLFCIAAGRKQFLGYPLNAVNPKCLFISYEEYSWGRLERNAQQLQAFTPEEQAQIIEHFIVSNQDLPRYITEESHWQALENEIAFHNPGVVVIDSLSRITLESNADEEIAKRTMKRLREICDKYGVTLMIINHTPKGANERPLTISSMSGSRIFMQESDFLFGVNRTVSNKRYLKLVCSRYDRDDAETVDSFVINDHQCVELVGKEYEATLLSESDARIDASNTDLIYQEMRRISEEKSSPAVDSEQLKFLFEDGTMTKKTLYNNLQKLLDKGVIKRLPGRGKYEVL